MAAKIPLDQHANGYVTLNGTFNDIPRTYIVDTTLPGLAHTCAYHSLKIMSGERWNETCPRECSSNLTIPMFSSKYGSVKVDPFASNLTFADIALPSFTSGRICEKETYNALDDLGLTANGVFGLGPDVAPSNGTASLETIPWSKYSIYLTKTFEDAGSFLLPGAVDADLIAKQALTETKLPATTETGWTVNIDAVSLTGASIKPECSPTSPCKATVASSSSVMQLGKDVWNSVMAGIDRFDCYKTNLADQDVYRCNRWALLPNVTFTLGDRTFMMNKTDYTLPVPYDDTGSVYVMIAYDNRNLSFASEWVLGTPFLRAFYSSFDKDAKTVSFYCQDGLNCNSKDKPAPGSASSSSAARTNKWSRYSLLVAVATCALKLLVV